MQVAKMYPTSAVKAAALAEANYAAEAKGDPEVTMAEGMPVRRPYGGGDGRWEFVAVQGGSPRVVVIEIEHGFVVRSLVLQA